MDPMVRMHRTKREAELDRTALNDWLGAEIQQAREDMGYTQQELARRMGKPVSWVKRMESRSSNPRYNDLQQILTELRCSVKITPWPR